jgi:hypothetical protein
VTAAGVGGSPDSAASRHLAAENEKLRAQMVALREQAAAAEDARRQARLAAENAAVERDEYREQAEELQQQLKEVMHVREACWGCGVAVCWYWELWLCLGPAAALAFEPM